VLPVASRALVSSCTADSRPRSVHICHCHVTFVRRRVDNVSENCVNTVAGFHIRALFSATELARTLPIDKRESYEC